LKVVVLVIVRVEAVDWLTVSWNPRLNRRVVGCPPGVAGE
jgi:hypothetical protein